MQLMQNREAWKFWRRWVLACTVGWFAGFLVGFVLADIFGTVVGTGALQSVFGYFVLGLGLGAMVGLLQWRLLRQNVSGAGWWIMASAAGLAVAGGTGYGAAVLAFGYSEGLEGLGSFAALMAWTLVVAAGGALAGALQWRILRRQVPRAGRWVLASTAGWGLSMAAAGAVMVVGSLFTVGQGKTAPAWTMTMVFLGGLVVGGVVLGVVTGAALLRLMRKPLPDD